MIRRHHLTLFLALLLVFAACGEEPVESNGGDGGALGLDGTWVLVAATVDGTTLALSNQYRVTMTIDGSEINGRAACNGYGGSVSIENGTFSLKEVFVTSMACEPEVMEIESTFMQGLSGVTSATRSGDTASLTGAGVDYRFEIVPPVPTADLIGPTWVLDAIIRGDTAVSTTSTADPATLSFDPDGTFTGGTGCREISGEYVVAGDTVQFTSFGAAGECGGEVEVQDGQVIAVLESGFTVGINGDRLTVTAPGGDALSYRAEQ
ncbi:MAG: META domain-containing protein [Acidobacteria bacterium]|nr:META domain-containing protein [Acidobacteriota bacterium]